MSDQSVFQPVSNTNRTPSRQVGSDAVSTGPRVGQIKKRFRRQATDLSTPADFATQLGNQTAQNPAPTERDVQKVQSEKAGLNLLPKPTTNAELAPPLRQKTVNKTRWDMLPFVSLGVRRHFLSGAPLINFFRNDPAARAFDLLRTRLLQTLRRNGWNRIAIASPTSGCGATFTAVNLAQSLARVPGSRTVLMDVNHRNPGVSKLLEIDKPGDMRGFLGGEVPAQDHLMRASKTLALGLATAQESGAAEILHDVRCGTVLAGLQDDLRPDVTLYDLPPILEHDDLAAFLPQVDGVLLVVDGTATTARQIAACERIMEGQTQLLGVILNHARKSEVE